MKSAFCSWSGGKDSCLALDRFLNAEKNCSIYLLTMMKSDTQKNGAHGLSKEILLRQARSLNVEITFGYSDFNNYEEMWSRELQKLKEKNVETGIFGDIDLEEHYLWIKRVLTKYQMEMVMPLWKEKRNSVVSEFVEKGYLAKIISINKKMMGKELLGKDINRETIEEMKKKGIDPSAEGGEFHTFVYDGPIFKNRIDFKVGLEYEDKDHIYFELI